MGVSYVYGNEHRLECYFSPGLQQHLYRVQSLVLDSVVQGHLATLSTARVVHISPSVYQHLDGLAGVGVVYGTEVGQVEGSTAVLAVAEIRVSPVLDEELYAHRVTQPGRLVQEVLVVEGWMFDYMLEASVKEINKGKYKYIITTGLEQKFPLNSKYL